MAGSGFSITIAAVDQATKVFDRINAGLKRFNQPMRGITAATDRLGNSVKKFADASGVTRIGKAVVDLGRGARATAGRMGEIVAPLGILTGAASIAGVYRLVTAWGDLGTKLGQTAANLGISVQALQGFQGAARLAGSSTEAMTSGLGTLADNLQGSLAGRAPEFVNMMNTIGLSFRDASGHARSMTAVLPEIADKIRAIHNPLLQARVATALLGSAGVDLLPVLRQGSARLAAYQEQARRYGLMTDQGAAAALRMHQAQTGLELSVQGLGNAVSERLSPILVPLLTQMADWIARNRDWIATGIGQHVQQLAAWIQSINWSGLIQSVSQTAAMFGGWKTALAAVVLVLSAPLIGAITTVVSTLGLLFTPVGMAIAAIAGISAAGYEVYQHWGDIKARFERLWDGIKGLFASNTGYIRTICELLFPLPAAIINRWGTLKAFFGDLWGDVTALFRGAWQRIQPIIAGLRDGVSWLANSRLGRLMGFVANEVGTAASGAASAVAQGASTAGQAIVNFADRATGYTGGGSAPRGIRNNNPLNLSYRADQAGVIGSDGRFGRFRTMADGIAATERQLLRYQDRGVNSLAQIVAKWAPPSENNTAAYIQQVAKWTGLDPNAHLDLRNADTASRVIGAMARMENGRQIDGRDVQAGVAQVIGGGGSPVQVASAGAGGAGAGVGSKDGTLKVDVTHRGQPAPGVSVGVSSPDNHIAVLAPRTGSNMLLMPA